MNVMPVIRGSLDRIDRERLNGVDQLQHALDLWPAGQPKQTLSPGIDPGHGRIALSGDRGAQNIDAGQDGSEVIGGPPHESKDAARLERNDAAMLIDDLFRFRTAKPNPV